MSCLPLILLRPVSGSSRKQPRYYSQRPKGLSRLRVSVPGVWELVHGHQVNTAWCGKSFLVRSDELEGYLIHGMVGVVIPEESKDIQPLPDPLPVAESQIGAFFA